MPVKMNAVVLDRLFRVARTRNGWTDRPVSETQIRELYDLLKLGPTSANSCPARFVWVRTPEGKARLAALATQRQPSGRILDTGRARTGFGYRADVGLRQRGGGC